MKHIIAAILLIAGISLGGCQATKILTAAGGFAITQQQLDAAENSYDGTALVTLHKYAQMPRCAEGQSFTLSNMCHDEALLKKMRQADKAVAVGFSKTQNQITSGNNTGALAAWQSLQTALGVMETIISQNNLGVI